MITNNLHISIGSCPSLSDIELENNKYLDHDLRLVKSALLYADTITLCSPACTMISGIAAFGELAMTSSLKDKIKFFEELTPKEKLPKTFQLFKQILKKKYLSRDELILKIKFIKQINKFWSGIRDTGYNLADGANLNEFLKAYEAGYLDFYQFKNAEGELTGKKVFKEFIEYLYSLVNNKDSYPLLDDFTSAFINAGIKEGKIKIEVTNQDRRKQIGLVSNLFEQLPILELANVDEIIDIRKELEKYLIRFRSAMIKYSGEISSSPWDENFKQEAEKIFYKTIEPTLQDIEDAIKSNSYLKKLTHRYASHPSKFIIPGISVAMTNLTNIPDLVTLAFGGAHTIANVFDVYNEWKEEFNKIEQNQLFFYYELGNK